MRRGFQEPFSSLEVEGRIIGRHHLLTELGVDPIVAEKKEWNGKVEVFNASMHKDDRPDPIRDPAYFVTERELSRYAEAQRVMEGEGRVKSYPKGTFIYRMAGRDRQKSASYYTPEVLTRCLVKYALKELLEDEDGKPRHAHAEDLLELTICEPAMGSAAVLNEAINQLADAVDRLWEKHAGLLEEVRARTTDPLSVYGHEHPRAGSPPISTLSRVLPRCFASGSPQSDRPNPTQIWARKLHAYSCANPNLAEPEPRVSRKGTKNAKGARESEDSMREPLPEPVGDTVMADLMASPRTTVRGNPSGAPAEYEENMPRSERKSCTRSAPPATFPTWCAGSLPATR